MKRDLKTGKLILQGRSYASEANADKAWARLNMAVKVPYFVASVNGGFQLVAMLQQEHMHFAGQLARQGINVFNWG